MATIKKSLSTMNASGMAQVMFYVVNGRKGRIRVKSGVFVPVQHWNEKKCTLSIPRNMFGNPLNELRSIKQKLETAETRTLKLLELFDDKADKQFIEKTLELIKNYNGILTSDIVNDAWKNADEANARMANKNVFALGKTYLESKSYSKESINHFRVVFRSMARYQFYCASIARTPFVWNIDNTTEKDIEGYFKYLAKEHAIYAKHEKKYAEMGNIYDEYFTPKIKDRDFNERGENSLVKYRKKLKTFWLWLNRKGYTTNDPFKNVSIGVEKFGTPYYLTREERNIIANYDFSAKKHLKTQRDIFMFQCFVGCRVGDLLKLTSENVVNNMLVYTPHKTKDESQSFTARIPLTESIVDMLAEYQGKDKQGRLLPFISAQRYNDAIKEILTECGITRNVSVRNPKTGENEMKPINEIASSHMARRTFCGIAYSVVKDPNIVGRMSGHVEGSRAFSRYRNIEDEMLKEVINQIK